MKIRFLNYRKYKMGKMPFYMYMPRISRYWSGKIWIFTILRDYGIELDFRKDWFNDMIPEKEKSSFWHKVSMRINLLKRQN